MYNTLKSFFFIFLLVSIGGCAASDKLFNGDEATYDENGKRDNGVSPNITGYLKEQVILENIKKMKEGNNTSSSLVITEEHPGWLMGVIANRSNDFLNVVIYSDDKKEFLFGSVPVDLKSYKLIWLPPGTGYYAEANGGVYEQTFSVLNNLKTTFPFNGVQIPCYYYIYKK